MTKVKICGMTSLEDAMKAHALGADMAGFIFFEKSPRRIEPEKARAIIEGLPRDLLKVGLFLDQDLEFVRKCAGRCRLDMLQLHGEESADYCGEIRKDFTIIKTFRIKEKADLGNINSYGESADFYLFDTFVEGVPGGTGKTFDWSLLGGAVLSRPIFLAGGLNPGNVKKAIEKTRPYAVDAASGVERSPGIKDYKLMKEFIENAKSTG